MSGKKNSEENGNAAGYGASLESRRGMIRQAVKWKKRGIAMKTSHTGGGH